MESDMQLYHGDCLEMIKNIPDGSIDLLLTDPPYNVSRENNFQTMGTASRIGMDFGDWDKDFDLTGWVEPMTRLFRENANVVIFCDWKQLSVMVNAMIKNHITPKRCLVLNKSNPAPFNRDRMFVNDVEFAVWGVYNSKDKPTKWVFNRENPVEKCVMDTTVQSSKLHPTMKDVKIMERLVRLLSNLGDTVLDPFAGVMTTGVACKRLGRKFVGIELDKIYYRRGIERIHNETV